MKLDGVLAYVINYKNTDYSPVLVENRFITYEENLKSIEIKCIFEVNDNLVSNVGKVKKLLQNTTIEHNNLEYDVILESMTELEAGENNFTEVNFICKGNIYKPIQRQVITGNGKLEINSNGFTPLSFKITNATGTITINDLVFNDLNNNQIVIVDGVKGTVTGIDSDKWLFWEFPKAEKTFDYRVSGNGTVEVSWRCKV